MSLIHGTQSALAKKQDNHSPTKRTQQDIERLARSRRARVSTSEGGTVRELSTRRRDTDTEQTLTTSSGKLLETSLEYRKTTSRPSMDRESSFTARTDMLGRRSSEARTQLSREAEDRLETTTRSKATDHFGITKISREQAADVTLENGSERSVKTSSRDSLGNRFTSSDLTRVETLERSTVTTNQRRARGAELSTESSTTWEDGVFTLSDSADWKNDRSVERSFLKETEYDPSRIVAKADRLAETVGKVLGWLGLEPREWHSELPADRMHEITWHQGDTSYVGARYGVSGGQSVTFDGQGLTGTFNRTAEAGVYAESSGRTSGRFGEASYDARAKAEAKATVDARGRLDLNGLDASLNAKVGAAVEVEVSGSARTKGLQVGDTELYAEIGGRAKASAEASAEATGTVQITRNPPTAIAKGTLGASAVAKVEGEIRASAGPFTIVGSAYASAGAEARATGLIGFEDGKLKIGGSAGAALGVGAGGAVTVEVDVAQIGELAKAAADVNHDGKLDLGDAKVAVDAAASRVRHLFGW